MTSHSLANRHSQVMYEITTAKDSIHGQTNGNENRTEYYTPERLGVEAGDPFPLSKKKKKEYMSHNCCTSPCWCFLTDSRCWVFFSRQYVYINPIQGHHESPVAKGGVISDLSLAQINPTKTVTSKNLPADKKMAQTVQDTKTK